MSIRGMETNQEYITRMRLEHKLWAIAFFSRDVPCETLARECRASVGLNVDETFHIICSCGCKRRADYTGFRI